MTDDPHIDPTEEPTQQQPTPEPEEPRRLTRAGSDAVIGGVASGLGRYFGVDPILFRIGFVVLAFAGGVGILAYLALLAFVPSDGEERPGFNLDVSSERAAAIDALIGGEDVAAYDSSYETIEGD